MIDTSNNWKECVNNVTNKKLFTYVTHIFYILMSYYYIITHNGWTLSMKTNSKSSLILSILIPLAVGSLSALLSGNAAAYSTLNKPAFSPPGFLFPIVWTILYILMGISYYIIRESGSLNAPKALTTYVLQLFLNFGWSIIFFGFSQYLLAFFWLLALIITILIMIYQFYQISPIAAYLQIPYLLWCLFAAYLNLAVYFMN